MKTISYEEKKSLISSLIKEIEIFPCDEAELPLKSILFNFPVYKDGGDVCRFLWDKSTHVSTWLEWSLLMSASMGTCQRFIGLRNMSSTPINPMGLLAVSSQVLQHFYSLDVSIFN